MRWWLKLVGISFICVLMHIELFFSLALRFQLNGV